MYAWALYKTSSKEVAEDLVQDTFLAAFKSHSNFKGNSKPKTWLFSILNNKITDYHRNRYKNSTSSDNEQSEKCEQILFTTLFDTHENWDQNEHPSDWQNESEHLLDNHEFIQIFQGCMQKLPPNWLSAIQLKYIEEKKGELICQELNISPTNFWQLLHRAKLQLRKCLNTNWFKK